MMDADHSNGKSPGISLLDAEMAEIPLLVARWQLAALETVAHDQGLTPGEMARYIIRDFLHWYFLNRPEEKKSGSPEGGAGGDT
jgi:hypothetical protein